MWRLIPASRLRLGSAVSRDARNRAGRRGFFVGQRIIAVCICLWFPGNGLAAEREVDLELVLAVDISESIDLAEATLQRQGFVYALRHPDVLDVIQRGRLGRVAITYIEWAGELYQNTLIGWTEIADAGSAAAFADAVEQIAVATAPWTSISGAIAFAARSFEDNGFRGERRIIDISGDGPNNNGDPVVRVRDRALAVGITINGLAIINDRPGAYGYPPFSDLDLYYRDCVIGGRGAFVVVADGFNDFARAILRKMVLEIAGAAPAARPSPVAADKPRPPCNAGEIQLQNWRAPIYDF